ncbi:SRPBCC domain-containing protein [Mesorhizobium sp. M1C.F.Ca.ET.193.01.1.1]|uniref:SRPBCC family protein n=1 Tax=unclassified Mesorhizobium TaxID=325217 RepID=UPI000FD348E1|nr:MULTISPECIES: SRPBCC domain-containing protein [unclassified Mesorhizobium]TGS92939.1 SRPBCC domain-containing protein [bacterium M00.F.Ca.ET.177.01.1.1]TGQ50455.1 SRPBCC domain-containing protein [Mesorhizobium sp. M1C.F.Ca.ET.210.01.1.1]TGQ65379.1 SRPBCC domain-containing protein [Mesorhizobium sp. M1C.F.Ca.ET.212.01.1.1]TGQ99304.1 SRPBCC domain-containing protein [Mesorhizobium sp. M1C.F.Ca.ET.204.01.1.1]TGR19635.1 SRPBCC domain-containing protein [Mesorhizobium sp. M1C.F.Ca.ET.196.01.1.
MLPHVWPRAMANGETAMAAAEILATPEQIFTALVTDEVERWWGSAETYRMTGWTADLRVGRNWSVTVRTADGRRLPASGVFLEIETPRRIVQTRRYDWDHPALGRHETTVAYLLEPTARGTRLTICHGGFAGIADAAAEHAEGWARVLGWLQGYFGERRQVA